MRPQWEKYFRLRGQQAQDYKEYSWSVLETARRPAMLELRELVAGGGDEWEEVRAKR